MTKQEYELIQDQLLYDYEHQYISYGELARGLRALEAEAFGSPEDDTIRR